MEDQINFEYETQVAEEKLVFTAKADAEGTTRVFAYVIDYLFWLTRRSCLSCSAMALVPTVPTRFFVRHATMFRSLHHGDVCHNEASSQKFKSPETRLLILLVFILVSIAPFSLYCITWVISAPQDSNKTCQD